MSAKQYAKFSVGQVIHHRLFDYRGVIIDVDPTFQGSEEWYDVVARSRPSKTAPWYKVLVHDAVHETYVAEQNLEEDPDNLAIRHPMLTHFFGKLEGGHYRSKRLAN